MTEDMKKLLCNMSTENLQIELNKLTCNMMTIDAQDRKKMEFIINLLSERNDD